MNLNMELVRDGEECEIVLTGRLDAQTAPEAGDVMLEQAQQFESIILNFSELGYISSAGLRILKSLRAAMAKKGGKLTLKGVSAPVMKSFEITGFAAFFHFV